MRTVTTVVLTCLAGASLAQGTAADRRCQLFSPSEVSVHLGKTVGPGKGSGQGSSWSCQWVDKDFEVQAILTVVGPDYFEEPSAAKGFKRLPGLGKKAWVAADAGWRAGVLLDDAAILVNLDGHKASEAGAVAFLKEAIKRRGK